MKTLTHNKQQGVALVISLIILVSLTMLGLTSMQRTTTDLAIAGNQRESGLMFQAAEAGLIVSENRIVTSTSNGDFNDATEGLYTVPPNDPSYTSINYLAKTTWADNVSGTAGTALNAYEQPRYLAEYLGDRSQNALAAVNIGGYGEQQTGKVVSIYRATARGVGLTGNSFRFVQSYFGKDAP
jgi:type IV pilus assembly protein PilX